MQKKVSKFKQSQNLNFFDKNTCVTSFFNAENMGFKLKNENSH